jgi:ElaB/YqjD/DUF883 family membrane-anchored ribosome-binding protein
MDNANGKDVETPAFPLTPAADPALAPGMQHSQSVRANTPGPGVAHRPARMAPYHVHGSVLEGGDSPAVLAQPSAVHAEGQGSTFRPSPRTARAARRARRALYDARDAAFVRYRRVSDGTDDYVHDNPWKSMALAGIGGFLIGLLISR